MHKVAVVGSGPAAFYAVQRLLSKIPASVDIFERLPVPFGLTRFGVAPDHPEVKNCQERFTEVAEEKNVHFYGNVCVGEDVSVKSLLENYNAVLFAYGAQKDRGLNVTGAEHHAVRSARDFVNWYNGDPDSQQNWNFKGVQSVSIIGNGNVALDVARILLRRPSELAHTDITQAAIDTLSNSDIKHVDIVGRRGVLNSAFTNKELRELLNEPSVAFQAPDLGDLTNYAGVLGRADKRKIQLLEKGSKTNVADADRTWALKFLRSPIDFVPASPTRLERIDYAVNVLDGPLDNPKAVATDEVVSEKCDLSFLSIGYRGMPINGMEEAGIPFNSQLGLIPTKLGRVPDTNAFATGWIRTGPQGVIVSTMMDAYSIGEEIAAFLKNDSSKKPGMDGALKELPTVSWQGWKRIDDAETSKGKEMGKPREKITNIDELLKIGLD